MPIIEMQEVKKNYFLGKTVVNALRGINLSIEKGEFVSIAGSSGSGKTTILNLIGCLDNPTEGLVKIDNLDTTKMNEQQLTLVRRNVIGFIFQSFNLVPVLNIYENVELPLLFRTTGEKIDKEWIYHIIESVGLKDHINHKPEELSGGQQQRVAIARAIAGKPKIILADEPTANLDSNTGEDIIELMRKLNKEEKTTFIFATHDPKIIRHAQRTIQLENGLIIKDERK